MLIEYVWNCQFCVLKGHKVCTIINVWVCPSVCPPVRGQFVKMLITLERHGIYFDQILHTYACQHCLTIDMRNSFFDGRGFAEHHPGGLWLVSENAHTSRTTRYFWITFCLLIPFKINQPLVSKTVVARPKGVHYNRCLGPSVCPSVRGQFSENAHNS